MFHDWQLAYWLIRHGLWVPLRNRFSDIYLFFQPFTFYFLLPLFSSLLFSSLLFSSCSLSSNYLLGSVTAVILFKMLNTFLMMILKHVNSLLFLIHLYFQVSISFISFDCQHKSRFTINQLDQVDNLFIHYKLDYMIALSLVPHSIASHWLMGLIVKMFQKDKQVKRAPTKLKLARFCCKWKQKKRNTKGVEGKVKHFNSKSWFHKSILSDTLLIQEDV